jgi:non-specific protein-tyrosine kinase
MRFFSRSHGPTGFDQLVMIAKPGSPAAEAYRTLRASIQLNGTNGSPRSVLFTSAGPEEGKSTTLANLGIAAAQAGARVILVDTDLRRPRLHEIFGLQNGEGVVSLLADGAAEDPVPQPTKVKGLSVLTSGPVPPNPVDLLTKPAMKSLVEALTQSADLVMLDSPPAGTLADASVLAGCVDGVVLVVDAKRTHRDQAQQAKTQLERVRANMLGLVLCNARVDAASYKY